MSCNPAIGGIAKGHMVREVDALGGIMGEVIDVTGIQFRLLNRSRGPAVQSPRAQADRNLYRSEMRHRLSLIENLTIIGGEAAEIKIAGDKVRGVELADNTFIEARAVVLTTGTFLNGLVHVGKKTFSAGRSGEPASIRLANSIRNIGFKTGRLKTGTHRDSTGALLIMRNSSVNPVMTNRYRFRSKLTPSIGSRLIALSVIPTKAFTTSSATT